ncbi:MAG TPA: ribonuclease E activity regulator RraA [Nevskiaceae bacterium]
MSWATADVCDARSEVQVCEPLFADYGGVLAFHGQIVTLKVFEDNALVRTALEQAGGGRVLVVDGGASMRCALVGGNLAALAQRQGWSGLLVYGAIRDTAEIALLELGVKAMGSCPRRSVKGLHGGRAGETLRFAGVSFHPGAWLYADEDGVVVSTEPVDP